MTYEPDTVRAYVDGELDQLAAARIARAAETDEVLARKIAGERALRAKLDSHFSAIAAERVPARLTAPIDAARKIVSLKKVRQRRLGFNASTLRWAAPAMAVALVLALIVLGLSGGPTESRDGLTFASNELAHALDEQLVADQPMGGNTRIMLSFADEDGTFCRGFARADLSGIACREEGGWHLRVQRDGIDVASGDYRQASSIDNGILATAQDMAAGPALDAEGERAAKARDWRAQ